MNIKSSFTPAVITALLVTVLVLHSSAQAAKLYKWVDADGKISYQDRPPPDEQEFEVIKTYSGSAQPRRKAAKNPTTQEAVADKKAIRFFTKSDCAVCPLVQNILQQYGLLFKTLDIENDPAVAKALRDLTGALQVPVVAIDETVINDFSRDQFNKILKDHNYPALLSAE